MSNVAPVPEVLVFGVVLMVVLLSVFGKVSISMSEELELGAKVEVERGEGVVALKEVSISWDGDERRDEFGISWGFVGGMKRWVPAYASVD